MLISLPFFILFLSAASGAFLHFRKVRLAYIWIFLTIMALLVWILVLFLPNNNLKPLVIGNWFSNNNDTVHLSFVIDHLNWPIIFMIITFNLAFLLSSVTSPNKKQDYLHWIALQVIVAIIILTLSSDNLWTVILCWTAYDILAIMVKLFLDPHSIETNGFKPYFIKFIGSIILIWIIAYLGFDESIAEIGSISTNLHLGFFLAALFHAGGFDFRLAKQENQTQKNLDYFTHIGSIVISISLLFRIPSPMLTTLTGSIIKIILSLFSIYSGLSCILAQDELKRSLNLIMTLFYIICLAFFIGNINAGIFWLVLLVLFLGVMKLFTLKTNFTLFMFSIYFLFSTGLPFTYLAYGSRGMLAKGFSFFEFLTIIPHALILAVFIRDLLSHKKEFTESDPWIQAVYYAGIFLPIISLAAISVKYISSIEIEFEYWWAGFAVVLISSLTSLFVTRLTLTNNSIYLQSIDPLSNVTRAWNLISNVGRLIFSSTGQLVMAISNLLEGRGGILWAIVLLALLLTILRL